MTHKKRQCPNTFALLPLILIFIGGFCQSCDEKQHPMVNKVEIKKVHGKYDFYINDTIFKVKGAGLDFNSGQNFKALAEAGGNTFRTWRTDKAPMELDSALKYNLKIAMGIEMDKELHHFDYNDTESRPTSI